MLLCLALAGCVHHRDKSPAGFADVSAASATAPGLQRALVTPDTGLVGKVTRANAEGRFVVLNFPLAHYPRIEQRLAVYRAGVKVGEVRVSGPQIEDNFVADLTAGEAQPGDEVREN